ncbi:MAG: ABC transporter ATP-binding protein [Rectinemataceae bacterium]|jgi:ABC-2 type transport system ATP-binding protein
MDAIAVDRLVKRFGSFVAVDGISFSVPEGAVFGLLGANGAGKSTAIRMLCGLLQPSSGSARVAGIDVARDPEGVKRSIGYMSQRFSLYEDLTVIENMRFFAGLYGVPRRSVGSESARVLSLTGLVGREDSLAGELPGGFRQRLALGCALLHEPRVLFLDEPTAGVDPLARRRFWDIIYKVAESGSTVLVTTHYLDEAEYCGTVTLMHAGRIVAKGSPARLKAERFMGTMLEIECDAPDEALRTLSNDSRFEEVSLFGSMLHAALAPGLGEEPQAFEELVRVALAPKGLSARRVERIPPSLEDVFIRVISENTDGGAK